MKKIIREELITESELDWIKNIEPKYMPKKGELIEVRYKDKDSFLQWLGTFKLPYLKGIFGKYIKGRVIDISDNFFTLKAPIDVNGPLSGDGKSVALYFPTINDNYEWSKPHWHTTVNQPIEGGIYVEDIGLKYVPISS